MKQQLLLAIALSSVLMSCAKAKPEEKRFYCRIYAEEMVYSGPITSHEASACRKAGGIVRFIEKDQ